MFGGERSKGGTVKYRITKDCGTGWTGWVAKSLDPAGTAWGVSHSQHRLARNVAPGDIFLHYIDNVHAWAGHSTVRGSLQVNHRDSHADWLAALPYVIPIERGIWLNKDQCERTVKLPRLSAKHYHRQAAFTIIPPTEAELIIEAIDAAVAVQPKASSLFQECWEIGAENYYKGIVKQLARGKCWLCQEDAVSWAARAKILTSDEELQKIRDGFLDAAHILADCELGPMTPDNLRALCPNCHRVVDRLSKERREMLLRPIR
jgi:hypothetical protein